MKNLKYSRSPFIRLLEKIRWTHLVWYEIGWILQRRLYTYHDIDNGTTDHYNWLVKPFFKLSLIIWKFNWRWTNNFAKIFCRYRVDLEVVACSEMWDSTELFENLGVTGVRLDLEENNTKWFWMNWRTEKSSIHNIQKVEIYFMFKQEAILYRLSKTSIIHC